MSVNVNDKSGLVDSINQGYSACGCGNRRYYTKAEIDEMFKDVLDPEQIQEIINQMFEEYIEDGDLYELIQEMFGDIYTKEEIDRILGDYASKDWVNGVVSNTMRAETARTENTYLKNNALNGYATQNWVNSQDFLKDITLTINGTVVHNNGEIEIEGGGTGGTIDISGKLDTTAFTAAMQAETARTESTYLKEADLTNYALKTYVDDETATAVTSSKTYTDEAISAATSDLASKSWVNGSIDGAMAAETARTEGAYVKIANLGNAYDEMVVTETENAQDISYRRRNTATGEATVNHLFVKKINDIDLISNTEQEGIHLPSFGDLNALVERIATLESQVADIQENCCGGGVVPARGNFIAIYNVTSTTQPTQILDSRGLATFSRAALEDNTTIPLATGYTFSQTGLQKVYYQMKTNTINPYSFWECARLYSITIPTGEGVEYIGNNCFNGCEIMTGCTIPSGVKEIGESAFRRCYALKSITVPDTVTSIGEYAFAFCRSLTAATLSNNMTRIENGLFHSATTLPSITIPNGVTYIGGSSFHSTALSGITFPNSVNRINPLAFAWCTNLRNVTFGTGISAIETYAFEGSYVSRFRFNGTNPPEIVWYEMQGVVYETFNDRNRCDIYVPASAVNAFKTTGNWTHYASRIKS